MERKVKEESMESITERLSSLDNLYYPSVLKSDSPSQRKSILLDLLSRDAAIFLERYGSQLTADELCEFDVLNDDYEVNWHLKNLRSKMIPTSEELRSRSVTVKNRRLAFLNKLIDDGQYFSVRGRNEGERTVFAPRVCGEVSGFQWKKHGKARRAMVRNIDKESRRSSYSDKD